MNEKQRLAIFIATALIALLVLLHAPWSGYITKESTSRPITQAEIEIIKTKYEMDIASGRKFPPGMIQGFVPNTVSSLYDLSPSDWYTFEPIGKWFGIIRNILGCSFLILFVTAAWCFLYRTALSKNE